MNINLLPKEKKSKPKIKWSKLLFSFIIILFISGFVFYLGLMQYEILDNEVLLNAMKLEVESYKTSESYKKVENLEAGLKKLQSKSAIKNEINEQFFPPMNLLNLIQVKPEGISFQSIQYNGDGSFKLAGGAANYQNVALLLSEFEKNKARVKPEDVTMTSNKNNKKEYVEFQLSGTLTKKE